VDSGQTPPKAVKSERELLVEVVTLLTQSHSELERRIAALEARLVGVERSVGTDAEERLVQLRGQVERLSARPAAAVVAPAGEAAPKPPNAQIDLSNRLEGSPPPAAPAPTPTPTPRPSLEKRLATELTQDRVSLVFIGAGVIALLYAALTQIRL
jgi:hypothetical protein